MATSTLIQRLDQSALVTSTTVPGGYTVVTTPDVSNRSQEETFLAGGTITAGDWVIFDTSATGAARVLTVIQSPATAGNPLAVGVALNSATAGQRVDVCIAGYAASANVATLAAGAQAKGQAITTSGAVAGRAIKYDAAVHTNASPVAVLLEDAAANVAAVWVFKQF